MSRNTDDDYSFASGQTVDRHDEGIELTLDVAQIASQRIGRFLAEAVYYWQRIAQSGLLLTVIALFIIGLIYYEQMIAAIPEWWPMHIMYALLFTWLTVRTPQRHFLSEADLVFLTPRESDMTSYFKRTRFYNIILQMTALLAALVLLFPVYRDLVSVPGQPHWAYFLLPIVLKGWNYYADWSLLAVGGHRAMFHRTARLIYTLAVLYWWFSWGPTWPLILFGLAGLAFFLVDRKLPHHQLTPWLRLLKLEAKQESRFYGFCQAFVDVPYRGSRVKRRSWLSWLSALLQFQQSSTYRFLYLLTWMRSREFFAITVRLTLLGLILLAMVKDDWGQFVGYATILFATVLQLKAIDAHHEQQLWSHLWPLSDELKKKSLVWLLTILLNGQAILMLIVIFWTGSSLGTVFLAFVLTFFSLWLYLRKG